jgi:flagellar biosynthesis/type III secretory pathway protein FliH
VIRKLEEERQVRYVSSVERMAIQQGLEQGIAEGREQGIQRGIQQGIQRGAQRQLLRTVEHRFGPVSEDLQVALSVLSIEQLEQLVDVALAVPVMDEFLLALATYPQSEEEHEGPA